jgi:phosphate transport system protein
MPRVTLDRQLHLVQEEVLTLGSMVEQAMQAAVEALRNRDINLALRIFEDDQSINNKRYAIENQIMILMATQQPMAHDLRLLAALLEVSIELERMGDYAKTVAKVTRRLGSYSGPIPMKEFSQMADLAVSMLHRALGAFIAEDSSAASQIPREDDQVDALFNRSLQAIITAMIADPEIIDHATLLMWVAHDLERMADRVSNICERTVFIVTGELLELEQDEDDEVE